MRSHVGRGRGRRARVGGLWLAVLAGCVPAALGQLAQPSQDCVVSVLNQTANVQPDGSWILPNIPSNLGPVRARVNCVTAAGTATGASSFFTLATNRMNAIPKVPLGSPPPAPAGLAISASAVNLTAAGQTTQLTVSVSFADGSTTDVTAAAAQTIYTTTNRAVATVSPGGLVTAVGSGQALIGALHEGIVGTVMIQVVLSGSTVGDGIPDDWKVAHGIDPNDPFAALEDPDQDGLTNLEEFQQGTDPHNPDTDGDGLSDGDEVHRYHTNPLLFDTDGDHVSDGLEVRAGSNPLDPNSVNLAGILAAMTVSPPNLALVYNTVLGEASRPLAVTGTLIDGTSLDITAPRYGTTFSSSDLTVASFGPVPGRVFAGRDGTATVTATNNGFTAFSRVTVQSFSPTALSFLRLPGATNMVAVAGSTAFVAGGAAGLNVVDVTDLLHPVLVVTLPLPGIAYGVAAARGYVYVAAGGAGLQAVDARTPAAPVVTGAAATVGAALDVAVRGGRAYVADSQGLRIFDLTNPALPVLLGGVNTPGRARGVDAAGGIAVVAAESAGVQVIDVSNPAQPRILGATATRANGVSNAAAVAISGNQVYVADGALGLGGLRVVDISVPGTPVVTGTTADTFGLSYVATDGRLALAADYYFINTVPIFDVSVLPPPFTARLDFNGPPALRDDNGQGIAIQDGVAFLAADRCLLFRFGAMGCGGLYIGRYMIQEPEPEQPQEPTVVFTAPAAGAVVHERNPLLVTADASDDVRVASVQFLVNGQPAVTRYGAPYSFTLTVPPGPGTLTLGAIATDSAGNTTHANPVTVTVVADDKPQVSILAPAAGSHGTEGTTIDLAATASDDVQVASVELLANGVSQGVLTAPPYRLPYAIAHGATQLTVQAIATDNIGQTATAQTVISIDPDLPPVVSIVDPPDSAQVIEGSHLQVTVGASDDVGVTAVSLTVAGQAPVTLTAPPYRFAVDVPLGVQQAQLTATATDTAGQVSTAGTTLAVIPDPLTTAVGRVVDGHGAPVGGAAVRCLDQTGASAADGTFSLPGVRTAFGPFVCGATATDPSGAALAGDALPVPPSPGGNTLVGDLTISAQLLYLGSGNGGANLPGRLLVLDDSANTLVPWGASVPPAGLSGLAFDGAGNLYGLAVAAAVAQSLARPAGASPQPDRVPRQAGLYPTAGTPGGSGPRGVRPAFAVIGPTAVLRLDPDTGAVASALGTFARGGGGPAPRLADLTYRPADGQLYALGTGSDAGTVFRLDLVTQTATPVATGLPTDVSGLAAGSDGRLDVLRANASGATLYIVEPADGAVIATVPITGLLGASAPAPQAGGMVPRPGTGTFLVSSVADGAELYVLDPAAGTLQLLSTPSDTLGGQLLALAFRPLGARQAVVTTVTGKVVDGTGAAAAGAQVTALGAAAVTDATGAFTLPNLQVRTGEVRVAVAYRGYLVLTPPVAPVAGGVTDLGTITVGTLVCVTGRVFCPRCHSSPVTVMLDLLRNDGSGNPPLEGEVTPDPTGRFCIDLRRGPVYFLRRQDLICGSCDLGTCQTNSLQVTDPTATGACGDPAAACQEVGNVALNCSLFCGS